MRSPIAGFGSDLSIRLLAWGDIVDVQFSFGFRFSFRGYPGPFAVN